MKRKKPGLILLFLIGFSILMYPTISDIWNTRRAEQLIADYSNSAGDDVNTEAEFEKAEEYNKTVCMEAVPDAFSIRDGIEDPVYEDTLNTTGNGMMAYIEIPQIRQTIPVYHYTSEEVLNKGAGHLFGSSLPIGGEDTNCVISAHRGLPSMTLFTNLDRMKEGDIFFIHVLNETLAYETDHIEVVEPTDTRSLAIQEGKDLVSLVTCTPYGVNTHRLIVQGHRVEYSEETYTEVTGHKPASSAKSTMMTVICGVIGLLIAVIVICVYELFRRKRRRRRKYAARKEKEE